MFNSRELLEDNHEVKYEDVPYYMNKMEIILNYNKRSLSPIIEESEDDVTNTSKTFIYFNNERGLDSTSTGCVESEVIMGVTKALMASNDTLFNIEDTFLEENIFSSHSNSQNEHETETTISNELKFSTFSSCNNIDYCDVDQQKFKDSSKSLSLLCDYFNVNDVLSPDQELTFTVDDQTCISVKCNSQKKEERISEPDLMSLSLGTKTENDTEFKSIEDLPNDIECYSSEPLRSPQTSPKRNEKNNIVPGDEEVHQRYNLNDASENQLKDSIYYKNNLNGLKIAKNLLEVDFNTVDKTVDTKVSGYYNL